MQNRPHTRAVRAISMMLFLALTPVVAFAAPYAAYVMDARTGEQLYSQNADTRLHPASLTKMMTLYIAFQAIQRGEITLDSMVTVSSNASSEPPSKLGLKTGQQIKLRYLLRAAAVKSANDAATAIGEAISGSEEAFAVRMNRTAAAMGMTNTTFKNANGLTQSGHLSTARDMSVLGRHVIYDFPQYYNLFSRRTADAGIAEVRHTNRRFLDSYPGADGIKTGFTNAAGFNLVASAQHGQERIITTVFGGTSTAQRNGKVKELMDMGFSRAPANAALQRPQPPAATTPATDPLLLSSNVGPATNGGAGKTVRVSGSVTRSLRPAARPTQAFSAPFVLAVDTDLINSVLAEAVQVAAVAPTAITPAAREVVTRISTSGGRHWGVNVGRYNSRYEAEKALLRVALNEMSTLDGAVRRVTQNARGFDANFMGLTREGADMACRRLQARSQSCFMIGSEG